MSKFVQDAATDYGTSEGARKAAQTRGSGGGGKKFEYRRSGGKFQRVSMKARTKKQAHKEREDYYFRHGTLEGYQKPPIK